VREYAAQKEIDEQAALGAGMEEKAEEFLTAGGEIY
jgi:phosphomethylpyrimidine synthase